MCVWYGRKWCVSEELYTSYRLVRLPLSSHRYRHEIFLHAIIKYIVVFFFSNKIAYYTKEKIVYSYIYIRVCVCVRANKSINVSINDQRIFFRFLFWTVRFVRVLFTAFYRKPNRNLDETTERPIVDENDNRERRKRRWKME